MPSDTQQVTKLPGDLTLPTQASELSHLYDSKSDGNKYAVEDFFRLPEKSKYELSPDGDYYAYMGPYERRQNIFVQKVGEEKVIRVTTETKRNIGGYLWASNNRLIFVKDSGGDENFKLFAVDRDGSNPKDLTPYEQVRIQLIDDLREQENELIIGMNKNNLALFEPYRINILTGKIEQIAENTDPEAPISTWKTDHEGLLRLATRVVNGTDTELLYRDTEDEPFRTVIRHDFRENITPLIFDFETPHHIWVSSNHNRDKSVIIKMDMHSGEEIGPALFEHPVVDVSQLGYSPRHKRLNFVSYDFEKRHYHFIAPERKAMQEYLASQLGDMDITVQSSDHKEENYIIRTSSDVTRGAYYHFNSKTKDLKLISEISPWIDPEDMVPMQPVSYTSRDGLTIHGYLTLPKGAGKNLPIIINPHGGPWHRDKWGFNPEVQLFASRGYAVFKMNFRGSVGYGRKFWESSFQQWGKSMQDDITDGVHWLIEQGIADNRKIAIYGGSYGGYATLAGLTFTPELYACGIDYVGVSNLFTFFNTIPPYWKPFLERMYLMVGHPEKDKEALHATSPALHTDKITAPLFVVQGANDPRVNIDESDQIVRSLRDRGIDVPYMVKYDEGHGYSNEENSFEMYKAAIGFLKKHLG